MVFICYGTQRLLLLVVFDPQPVLFRESWTLTDSAHIPSEFWLLSNKQDIGPVWFVKLACYLFSFQMASTRRRWLMLWPRPSLLRCQLPHNPQGKAETEEQEPPLKVTNVGRREGAWLSWLVGLTNGGRREGAWLSWVVGLTNVGRREGAWLSWPVGLTNVGRREGAWLLVDIMWGFTLVHFSPYCQYLMSNSPAQNRLQKDADRGFNFWRTGIYHDCWGT